MSTVNSNTICSQLQTKLGQQYSLDNTVEDVISLALAANIMDLQNIITVPNIDSLPNLKYNSNIQNGMIYYIENIDVHAVSSNGVWLSLDGRTIRTDSSYDRLWAWGANDYGKLGDGTTVDRSSPVSVIDSFNDWCQVNAGGFIRVGLRRNGTIWTWGRGTFGNLGDGTVSCKSSPVSVIGGFTDWCQISTNDGSHVMALRTNGTIWTWGSGSCGVLGDGTVVAKCSPVSVVGGFTDWCQVGAGTSHNLAIRTNGTAWAWGRNVNVTSNGTGQLGDGTTVNKSSPVSVIGGFTDWCQVSAGQYYSLGLRTNGTAWAWGYNSQGRLGDGTTIDKSSPVSVVGGFTDWCQVSAGFSHSLGLRSNGTLWAWGNNLYGKLGDNTAVAKSSPVSVVGGFTDWCQVGAGFSHSAALRTNGTVWSWGSSVSGQLGNYCSNTSSPTQEIGNFTDWSQISNRGNAIIGIRKKL